jgi:hypothetical protein
MHSLKGNLIILYSTKKGKNEQLLSVLLYLSMIE